MAVTKRISGDYNITSLGANDNINLTTNTVTINGNLIVMGNSTNVESTTLVVGDNIITLNGNLSSSTAPSINAGITVNRGSSANVFVLWNESVQKWQITNDGSVYGNIAVTSGTGGTALTAVVEDTAPQLGGNLDITARSLYDTANVVSLYTGTVSGGGSGMYVSNETSTQELATQSAAIKYAIIFG